MMIGFGFGLALGGGLVYLLTTNLIALMVFFGMTMFVLGCLVVGVALLVNNRQWTRAMFNGGGQQRVNYNYRLDVPPFQPGYQPPAGSPASRWPASPPSDFDFPAPLALPANGSDEPEAIA